MFKLFAITVVVMGSSNAFANQPAGPRIESAALSMEFFRDCSESPQCSFPHQVLGTNPQRKIAVGGLPNEEQYLSVAYQTSTSDGRQGFLDIHRASDGQLHCHEPVYQQLHANDYYGESTLSGAKAADYLVHAYIQRIDPENPNYRKIYAQHYKTSDCQTQTHQAIGSQPLHINRGVFSAISDDGNYSVIAFDGELEGQPGFIVTVLDRKGQLVRQEMLGSIGLVSEIALSTSGGTLVIGESIGSRVLFLSINSWLKDLPGTIESHLEVKIVPSLATVEARAIAENRAAVCATEFQVSQIVPVVHIYEQSQNQWELIESFSETDLGMSLCSKLTLSRDGNVFAYGVSDFGSKPRMRLRVRNLRFDGLLVYEQTIPSETSQDRISDLAISQDGSYLGVGTSGDPNGLVSSLRTYQRRGVQYVPFLSTIPSDQATVLGIDLSLDGKTLVYRTQTHTSSNLGFRNGFGAYRTQLEAMDFIPPRNLSASDDLIDRIELNWSGVPFADGYAIYRRAVGIIPGEWEFQSRSPANTYTDWSALLHENYEYAVKAFQVLPQGAAITELSDSDMGRIPVPAGTPQSLAW